MKNTNKALLDEFRRDSQNWDNADGYENENAFHMDDAFKHSDGQSGSYQNDAAAAGKARLSQPYIFTVNSTSAGQLQINLFLSEQNRTAGTSDWTGTPNYGNNSAVQITYQFAGYTYGQLLARTESAPFTVGRIRLESTNALQLSNPISVTKTSPTGEITTNPIVNFIMLNQYYGSAIETETDFTMFGGVGLVYTQYASTLVKWYVWAADVASLVRGVNGQNAVINMRRPDTYLNQTIKFPPSMAPGLGR